MKLKFVFRYILLMVVIVTFVSCSNDDYKTGADDVSDTVKDGTWRVGYFYDSGVEKTQEYEGYNFTFGNNTILTASKEDASYTGAWSVSKSSSDDDIHSTIFMIAFSSPELLIPLTGNWIVVENTGTSVKLEQHNGSETDIDHLNFEKN